MPYHQICGRKVKKYLPITAKWLLDYHKEARHKILYADDLSIIDRVGFLATRENKYQFHKFYAQTDERLLKIPHMVTVDGHSFHRGESIATHLTYKELEKLEFIFLHRFDYDGKKILEDQMVVYNVEMGKYQSHLIGCQHDEVSSYVDEFGNTRWY